MIQEVSSHQHQSKVVKERRTRRRNPVQQVARVNESEGCACVKRPFDFAPQQVRDATQGRLAEPANAGY